MITSRFARSALALALGAASIATQASPVKIGLIESLSGPQAATGQQYRSAARFAVDQINAAGGWNGKPVEYVEYDNQGGPAGAADKLKSAIADGVQIVVQGASSAIGGQITEDVRKHNLRNPGKEVVYLNVGAEALELTGEKCHFHHFRVGGNSEVRIKALVAGMKQDKALGGRVYSINQNYSWGQDVEKAIVANQSAGGYLVVEKTLHDTNKVQDFAPYVTKIAATNADTVMTGNWSNDLLLLMKATKAAGLKARFGTVYLDQPGNLANAGELALGHYVVQAFNPEVGGPAVDAFVNDYRSKSGRFPVAIEPQTVYGLLLVGEALKQVKPQGDALNVNAFAKALETAKLKGPMGEISMRAADHQLSLPLVVSVASKDAKFKVDGTDMGFKPVKVFTAQETSAPVQAVCKMQRPD